MTTSDRIKIIEPNGVERTRPITFQGLTIGRGADNSLTLAYNLISRYHAQVTYQDGRYYVTDLNSANGTYVNKNRLTPNTPTVWPPGAPLGIGEVTIYLERISQMIEEETVDAGETTIGQLPDDTLFRTGGSQKKRQIPVFLWITLGVILLCFLMVGVVGAVYLFA